MQALFNTHCYQSLSYSLYYDGDLLSDHSEYRCLVGCLQYLTLSRLVITFVVNHMAQFMSTPSVPHLVVVKRILHYVKGTLDYGICLRPHTGITSISAFSDANWACCPDLRRSTTCYLPYL